MQKGILQLSSRTLGLEANFYYCFWIFGVLMNLQGEFRGLGFRK